MIRKSMSLATVAISVLLLAGCASQAQETQIQELRSELAAAEREAQQMNEWQETAEAAEQRAEEAEARAEAAEARVSELETRIQRMERRMGTGGKS